VKGAVEEALNGVVEGIAEIWVCADYADSSHAGALHYAWIGGGEEADDVGCDCAADFIGAEIGDEDECEVLGVGVGAPQIMKQCLGDENGQFGRLVEK
jgi:hypothetical protein